MTTTDYLIDSTLVLLVLLQIRERPLTDRTLIRPLVILGVAIAIYIHGIPAAGNDLELLAVFALAGGAVGVASGLTVLMRPGSGGEVLMRTGWSSAFFWVVGMGSRFAFIFWMTHSGAGSIADFSAAHSITGADAWTVALLAMATFEVVGRTMVLASRRYRLSPKAVPSWENR